MCSKISRGRREGEAGGDLDFKKRIRSTEKLLVFNITIQAKGNFFHLWFLVSFIIMTLAQKPSA